MTAKIVNLLTSGNQVPYNIINRYYYCRLFTSELLAETPIVVNERPVESVQRNLKYSNWIYEEHKIRRLCNRNITNMFKKALIGSRPMYRDDILYDGNISLLMTHKKVVFDTKIKLYNTLCITYIFFKLLLLLLFESIEHRILITTRIPTMIIEYLIGNQIHR